MACHTVALGCTVQPFSARCHWQGASACNSSIFLLREEVLFYYREHEIVYPKLSTESRIGMGISLLLQKIFFPRALRNEQMMVYVKYNLLLVIKESGRNDVPALGFLVFDPKEISDAAREKIVGTLKRDAEGLNYQKVLKDLDLPYDYKDGVQLEKELPNEYETYKNILNAPRVKKDSGGS